jgi:uncharacterized membrane protein YjgN (DUF898 family)
MTTEPPDVHPFSHTGKFFNAVGLALKNAGLTIVTLTLYRFWARTSMRRRIWSHAWVMGDSFEYTGTGWELFRGFLISLIFFFIPATFVLYIAPLVMEPTSAAWLTFAFYVILVPLFAAARYWMRRYQLSRTRWRGIRMGLDGSAWGFAAASWGWWWLQQLSLGWYTPVARINRARLMWNNTRFGDQPFEFIDDGRSPTHGLWLPFALGWFGFVIAYIVSLLIAGFLIALLAQYGIFSPTNEDGETNEWLMFVTVGITILTAIVLAYSLWAPYRAAAMNRIASLILLDGARFKLRVKTIPFLLIQLAGWAMIILSLGLLAPLAGYMQVRYISNRLVMIGTPKFADINQPTIAAPGAGESLADAFDLDMGVGLI